MNFPALCSSEIQDGDIGVIAEMCLSSQKDSGFARQFAPGYFAFANNLLSNSCVKRRTAAHLLRFGHTRNSMKRWNRRKSFST